VPVLEGDGVVLRPLEPDDASRLRDLRALPEVATWWGPPEDDFPFGDDDEAVRFAILEHGRVVGLVQYGEEPEAMYRQAWIDLYLDPACRGRGLGVAAIRRLIGHLFDDLGHHRITIDPAAANTAAIRAYEKAGFRRVGTLELAERGPLDGIWRDSLLMELVRRPATG
jgi:aminoglycoside 6'-N-acetyltransferase